jgi:hypothetical protein
MINQRPALSRCSDDQTDGPLPVLREVAKPF